MDMHSFFANGSPATKRYTRNVACYRIVGQTVCSRILHRYESPHSEDWRTYANGGFRYPYYVELPEPAMQALRSTAGADAYVLTLRRRIKDQERHWRAARQSRMDKV